MTQACHSLKTLYVKRHTYNCGRLDRITNDRRQANAYATILQAWKTTGPTSSGPVSGTRAFSHSDPQAEPSEAEKRRFPALVPCFNPTRVVMGGDHRLHFDRDWRHAEMIDGWTVVNVRCRHCIGCNRAEARDWSVRAFHESLVHAEDWTDPETKITTEIPNSSVLTLTYNDEHLPEDGCLRHDDFQRFMKRLRIRRQRRHKEIGLAGTAKPIRYLMCGEYGGKTSRPHYHCITFGESFSDRYSEQSLDGQVNQMSVELDELWAQSLPRGSKNEPTNMGRATVDDFTFAGAAYVAGYVAKKTSTAGHQGPIQRTTDQYGVTRFSPISPEYRKSSTRPGLGASWILRPSNLAYVYSMDCVKISEWTFHPPKYYDLLLNRHRPELVEDIMLNRRLGMSEYSREWTPQRCAAAEQIALDDLQQRRDSL